MECAFTYHELEEHSLTGKTCGANRNKKVDVKPAAPANKVEAIISEYSNQCLIYL